jgi:hypothetical protein
MLAARACNAPLQDAATVALHPDLKAMQGRSIKNWLEGINCQLIYKGKLSLTVQYSTTSKLLIFTCLNQNAASNTMAIQQIYQRF